MEAEGPKTRHLPRISHGVFPALSAALFVAMGYIDLGKWAACIDSGARFGGDLAFFLFLFNLMAILCQYLSVHIGVVTGKNLAQICNAEYDQFSRIFLGIQAEVSIIMSDLAMILGIANGLHMILRVDLFVAVILAALDAIFYPLLSTLLVNSKARGLVVRIAGLIFVCYVLGLLIGLPEVSISPIVMPSKLNGENVYALISLLGANIMPHNFYLHSSIVQRFQGSTGEARAQWAYENFFSIFAIFSNIFLINYVLMNSASNIFYSSELVLSTFQDAMSLMDQSLWSPMRPLGFLLLISSSHISGLSWGINREGKQAILYDFFGIDLPDWLHCATVRIFATIPALYCLWYSGAEGMYQMLISTQIMVGLLLPASVVALCQIAASGALMGASKISAVTEFFMMMLLMAMIGLQIIFLGEMVFGDSAWLGYLRWNMGTTSISSHYFILIVSGWASLCFTCRIFVTPLRSADERPNARQLRQDRSEGLHVSLAEGQENDMAGSVHYEEQIHERPKMVLSPEKVVETDSDTPAPNGGADLPATTMETYQKHYLTPIEESPLEQATSLPESVPAPEGIEDSLDNQSGASNESKVETADLVERTVKEDDEPATSKDGEVEETWEPEEISKEVLVVAPAVVPEGLSGRLDEGGNGDGSLSRLSGLGRAARRQLAAVLDEFWGHLYDYHGLLTKEAKANKLNLLLGADSNSESPPSLAKADSVGKDFGSHLPIGTGRSHSLMNSNFYDASIQQRLPSAIGSAYGAQKVSQSSSLWSDTMQVMGVHQTSGGNALDNSDRWYTSLRLPPSSEGMNYQPAASHGYQLPSYLNQIAKDQPFDYINDQREYESLKTSSPSLGTYNSRDPHAFGLSPTPTNGYNSVQSSNFQNLPASRNSMLQSDVSNYELFSPSLAENVADQDSPKKYHSLPDISENSLPLLESYFQDKYNQLGNPTTGLSTVVGRNTAGRPLYPNVASRVAPPGFDELLSRKPSRDVFQSRAISGLDAGSLWHTQPFEQFGGVANKPSGFEGAGQESVDTIESATSIGGSETKLLQSLKCCILKLLRLEGSEWLFKQTDGADEDLVERVAAKERFFYESECKDMKLATVNEFEDSAGAAKPCSAAKGGMKNVVSPVTHCGEGCVWKADLIVSFGVWCIHRILELSLLESRPELWGKYTYVLNRLQGVIDPAFFRQRVPTLPCFCLQMAAAYQQRLSPFPAGALPPTARPPSGKFTTAPILLDIIKDIEIAISSRKGRSGTAAGDVAFPKGKENLASVLKRYKRRLSNKHVGPHDGGNNGPGPRKLAPSGPYAP